MAIVEVEGQQFEFPDGTSDAVIGTAIQKHFADQGDVIQPQPQSQPVNAGQQDDPGILSRVSELFTGAQRTTPQIEQLEEIGGAPELNELSVPAFKASVGLLSTGQTEPLKAILTQQFGDNVSFSEDTKGNTVVNLPSGQYALNKPGLSGQDVIRSVFDLLAFTPAGRAATIPIAIGKSAATQAAIEGAEAGVGGEFDATNVALAGGLGGVLKGAEDVISAGVRLAKGSPISEVVEAGRAAKIPVLTTDVVPPQTFVSKTLQQTSEKIPFAGTGATREAQQAARVTAVNEVSERYGEFSYNAIVDSLKTRKDKVKKAAGSVLNSVGKKLDGISEIPFDKTRQTIQDVSAELSKPGVIRSEGAIADLKVLSDTISGSPQTFTTLRENRTAFREILKGADKAERSQLTSRAKSLLGKVESSMKSDMDAFAKSNLTPREFTKWQRANKVYADEAFKLTKTKLKNILDKGDVTPEAVQSMLFSQKPSEVNLLFKSLTPSGRANARSAIISKVVSNLNKRAGGITPTSFATEMGKFGLQTNKFFKGEEKKALDGLLKVLNATRRAQEAGVTTPTGQQLIGLATGVAAVANLPLTIALGGTLGATARLIESPAVRNALLRLDSIPRGSARFDQALQEAQQLLNAGAQSIRPEVSE